MLFKIILVVILVELANARPDLKQQSSDDSHMHRAALRRPIRSLASRKYQFSENFPDLNNYHLPQGNHIGPSPHAKIPEAEFTTTYWQQQAQLTLNEKLHQKINTNVAKNVIMFLGDGMSIPTIAAARMYQGQLKNVTGEETKLSFDEFPYIGLSKTYCVDKQVADSACSASAYLCGVKANEGTIGVNAQVPLANCEASTNTSNHLTSIARWSQMKGKKTGVVTTTRITHASPAGIYASIAQRDWESDYDIQKDKVDPLKCRDIAYQLVHGETGKNLNVILGGGRKKFMPKTEADPEGDFGERLDGVNLINDWIESKAKTRSSYVWNRRGLRAIPDNTEYLMGLFENDHCKYNLETTEDEPTLSEMVETAIRVLSKTSKEAGYFLFVEGGRIDHAHHDAKAHKALDETVQFSEAIRKAQELVDGEDTLIVVTSDHAHTMSISGYPERGNDIFGIAGYADDKLPYATLTYANGNGYTPEENGKRHDLTKDDMNDIQYTFPGIAPIDSETHGGEDVAIFAKGPWAHLFTGVVEQNVIPHMMAYASCVGDGVTVCDN